jgi:hypothetical protein
MKTVWEVTLIKHDGRVFTELFDEKEMATRYAVYRAWKYSYKSYSVKEVVVD